MAELNWNGKKVLEELERQLAENRQKAADYLTEKIRENLAQLDPSEGGPSARGDEPAVPGGRPHPTKAELQASIQQEEARDGQSVAVGTTSDAAADLELGTRLVAPHPFLRPTLDQEKEAVLRILTQFVE